MRATAKRGCRSPLPARRLRGTREQAQQPACAGLLQPCKASAKQARNCPASVATWVPARRRLEQAPPAPLLTLRVERPSGVLPLPPPASRPSRSDAALDSVCRPHQDVKRKRWEPGESLGGLRGELKSRRPLRNLPTKRKGAKRGRLRLTLARSASSLSRTLRTAARWRAGSMLAPRLQVPQVMGCASCAWSTHNIAHQTPATHTPVSHFDRLQNACTLPHLPQQSSLPTRPRAAPPCPSCAAPTHSWACQSSSSVHRRQMETLQEASRIITSPFNTWLTATVKMKRWICGAGRVARASRVGINGEALREEAQRGTCKDERGRRGKVGESTAADRHNRTAARLLQPASSAPPGAAHSATPVAPCPRGTYQGPAPAPTPPGRPPLRPQRPRSHPAAAGAPPLRPAQKQCRACGAIGQHMAAQPG